MPDEKVMMRIIDSHLDVVVLKIREVEEIDRIKRVKESVIGLMLVIIREVRIIALATISMYLLIYKINVQGNL